MTTKHLKKWAPGESGNPAGRPAGAKNRLQSDFLHALAEDFREHGAGVIRICRIERPTEYLKIIAGVLPKELDIHATTVVQELSGEEIEILLERAKRQLLQQSAIEPLKMIEVTNDKVKNRI
jgi:Family of unknown function (DUF5681)